MKMLFRILSALVISTGLTVGVASAATVTCNGSISDTGPDSTNSVKCTGENSTKITCKNDVIVDNSNEQDASSGNGFTVDNTTAGDVVTGNADNSNTSVVKLGISCAPVQVATTTVPTPTPAAAAPAPAAGMGGGQVAAAPTPAPSNAAQVSALPETGSNNVLASAIAGLAILSGVMLASRLGILAYKRHSLK